MCKEKRMYKTKDGKYIKYSKIELAYKVCISCERVLSLESFTINDKKRGYRRPDCKKCHTDKVNVKLSNKYYVYANIDNDGNVFYIGKGCGRRHRSSDYKNEDWKAIAKKGFTSKILKDCLTNDEAYELEKLTIKEYGLNNLVNRVI